MANSLGPNIRALRQANAWTLQDLADAIGTGKSYISELENSVIANPSVFKIKRIADVLDTTVDHLLYCNTETHNGESDEKNSHSETSRFAP